MAKYKVYIVKQSKVSKPITDYSDKDFQSIAEEQKTVYSLKEFNNLPLRSFGKSYSIRFLKV